MKAYETAAGVIVRTQDEAKASGKGWQALNIPTDQKALIAFINERCKASAGDVVLAALPVAAEEPAPAPAPPPARIGAITLTDAEEFIQQSDGGQLARLADNVCWRIKELVGGLR